MVVATPAECQPAIAQQAVAQNEAIQNVLLRFENDEIVIPAYQRDGNQWDDAKKSLFIESILNRLTIPAFYFALVEDNLDISEVVDGQQRLTTLIDYFNNKFKLLDADRCSYYGNGSSQYEGRYFSELDDAWQRSFRRYNLTIVVLPSGMDLGLRLEIFRRINEGGTPLSDQDIRLSYFCESECVRYIQAVGVVDPESSGSQRIIKEIEKLGCSWPWSTLDATTQHAWQAWWKDTATAYGQSASRMFLWYLVSQYHDQIDRLVNDESSMAKLRRRFHGNIDEVLDIVCAQLRLEDATEQESRVLPSLQTLQAIDFPRFAAWWYVIRDQCGSKASVAKYRQIALLIPQLAHVFHERQPTESQWYDIQAFIVSARDKARELKVNLAEPKGKWRSQSAQIAGLREVAMKIACLEA